MLRKPSYKIYDIWAFHDLYTREINMHDKGGAP